MDHSATNATTSQIAAIDTKRWQSELNQSAESYHLKGAWIAIIFDPIFGLTDFLNIPEQWWKVMILRLTIAVSTFVTIIAWKKVKFANFWLVLIPVYLISLQNAYTYSLIQQKDFLGHTLNYIALFIGAGMFILWRWQFSAILIIISGIASAFFYGLNPERLSFKNALIDGGLLLAAVTVFMLILIQSRYRLTVREIKARLALEEANKQLAKQKEEIEHKNKSITDSIRYASRIQQALLGDQSKITERFSDAFIFFSPRDIVSGDFYWFKELPDGSKITVAADCTGHGVPGAFMTVMGNVFLNEIVTQQGITDPAEILHALDRKIINALQHETNGDLRINDGMDVAVILIRGQELFFAGAKNPLYFVREGEIFQLKGSKFPVGSNQFSKDKEFFTETLATQPNDIFYLFSDGFQDQFGGEDGKKKYLTKRFREFLQGISHLPLSEQQVRLQAEFRNWKQDRSQTDDVLVMGMKC